MATITGTAFRDVLNGTAGDDIIDGLGGFDQINGGGGNDLLRGGSGGDSLDGGSGNDRLEGGDDGDILTDNDGGNDLLFGDAGNDYIYVRRDVYRPAVSEKVEIYGGIGDDSITYFNVSPGSAFIDAGDGLDRVILERPSTGVVVTLGAGQDVLDLSQLQLLYSPDIPANYTITVTDFEAGAGGDGIAWITALGHYLRNWNQSLNPFSTGHLSFRQDGADAVLRVDTDGAGGFAAYDFIRFENVQVSALTSFNLDGYRADRLLSDARTLIGGADVDFLIGDGGHDLIDGGLNDDQLYGRGGDDTIRGGWGADSIEGGPGTDRLQGDEGDDAISDVSGGSDVMEGGAGNDSLYLYRLNQSLDEAVIMRGGDGDDYFTDWSYAKGTVTIDGGAGTDTIVLRTSNHSQSISLGDGADTVDLSGFQAYMASQTGRVITDFQTGADGDTVLLRELLTSQIAGYDGTANPFLAGVLHLEQRGAGTVLQINGLNGTTGSVDLLVFENTTSSAFIAKNFGGISPTGAPVPGETFTGTAGNDTLTGTFGDDVIDGLGGGDILQGDAGNDVVRGGDDNDTIRGGAGDDVLDGGRGDDTLEAIHERGSDVFRGGDGDDFIFIYRNFSGATENVTIDGGTGKDRVIYQNFDQGSVTMDLGDDADTVTLYGARGATTITLGAGADVIDFDRHETGIFGEFTITITDYKPGEDRLDWGSYFGRELVGWNQQDNPFATGFMTLQASGADVQLLLDRDGAAGAAPPQLLMTLKNVAIGALTRADFGGLPPDGSDLDRIINGTGGDDTLAGGTGNDRLDGAAGNDTLIGGAGDDTYFVDARGDTIVETAGQGSDRVLTGVSYALAAGVSIERLTTTFNDGTAAINLTGNELANMIYGNAGNNVLDGGGGADTLVGLAGDDWYRIDHPGDRVIEASGQGSDRVSASVSYALQAGSAVELLTTDFNAGTAAINLTGNEFANTIYGNAGANILNGGGGIDTLVGLAGDDWYYVDNAGDRIIETAGQGNDRILASMDYVLGAGVQVELLTTDLNAGTAAIDLTGNELANTIYGNAGNNILDGKAGADTMLGLSGDDWYFVDNAADRVIESAGQGTDRVLSSVSYTLGAGVSIELLTTDANAGSAAISLTGNELANTIYGNAGANVLNGGGGADTLVGLGGDDSFIVDNAGDQIVEGAGGGIDRVYATTSYALTGNAQVELLTTSFNPGTAAIDLTGNDFDNTIYGNAGANVLHGGGGDDTILGLGGNDQLFGDAGNDQFMIGAGFGKDVINDFANPGAAAGDTVRFLAGTFASFNDLMSKGAQQGTDAVFTLDANNSLTLHNVQLAALTAQDFIFG